MKKKKENVFRTLARWFVRLVMGVKYEEKWFYKMRAIFTPSPYLTMFFNKFQIALGKEVYTLVWPEESMPKLLKLGKEVQMYEKLQEIKKDF